MTRPRILLVPSVTELEWRIKPLLEEWAEVASFDAPGIGEEPGETPSRQAIIDRGLAEIERRGWERCVIVGDEAGAAQAVRIAVANPGAVAGLALGHATLSYTNRGPRAPINAEILDALITMAKTDFMSYVRALSQVTQQAYDDEFASAYVERVPKEMAALYLTELVEADEELESPLRSLGVPLLMVEHKGCLMWTADGFEDAVGAFPEAATASMELKPSVNPEFAALLREFCEGPAG